MDTSRIWKDVGNTILEDSRVFRTKMVDKVQGDLLVARVRRERGQWVDWEDPQVPLPVVWCTPGGGEPHVPTLLEQNYCILEGQVEVILNKKVVLGSCNFPFIVSTNRIWVNWITNSLALLAWAITGNAWAGLSPTSHGMGRAVGWCVSIEIEWLEVISCVYSTLCLWAILNECGASQYLWQI